MGSLGLLSCNPSSEPHFAGRKFLL